MHSHRPTQTAFKRPPFQLILCSQECLSWQHLLCPLGPKHGGSNTILRQCRLALSRLSTIKFPTWTSTFSRGRKSGPETNIAGMHKTTQDDATQLGTKILPRGRKHSSSRESGEHRCDLNLSRSQTHCTLFPVNVPPMIDKSYPLLWPVATSSFSTMRSNDQQLYGSGRNVEL